MVTTIGMATSQEARSHPKSAAVCILRLVALVALHSKRTTETKNPPQETTELVPTSLGVSATATAYAVAATDSGDSVTGWRAKVRVGQLRERKSFCFVIIQADER